MMKSLKVLMVMAFAPIIMLAQPQSNYKFNSQEQDGFSVSGGLLDETGWTVNSTSSNFYTNLTKPDAEMESVLDVSIKIRNSGNLDNRDFAWIFYYVNGNIILTKTLRGDKTPAAFDLIDSIAVPADGNFKIRIAFVSDENDEFWRLNNGELIIHKRGSDETAEELPATPPPDLITASRIGNKVKIRWSTAFEEQCNYFLIERSNNGSDFKFAGYVKGQGNSNDSTSYSFIDTEPGQKQSWYKISEVDFSGHRKPFGEVVKDQGE
jgi:hypothetical protein